MRKTKINKFFYESFPFKGKGADRRIGGTDALRGKFPLLVLRRGYEGWQCVGRGGFVLCFPIIVIARRYDEATYLPL
ncbi:hypothetical protein DU508_15670 [Pedobacter chinensis]|uniref:Uncharacterized protein n=1 Tax=Pedobacter chinensis TaxID=2282421 RepID=A0A369PXJ9_9SPHI|nr:hypothetical protein DU508_15670 [Pedobacter chinensis]